MPYMCHGEPSKPRGSLHWGSQMKNNYIHETISNKILNIKLINFTFIR